MVGLSLSQPLEIAKQFTIIQSINLSRAGETQCPWFHDEALCIPDETTRGNNSFSGPNKEDRKDNKRKERVVEDEKDQKACLEEDKEYVWEKLLLGEAYRLRVKDGREVLQWLHCPQYLTFFSGEEEVDRGSIMSTRSRRDFHRVAGSQCPCYLLHDSLPYLHQSLTRHEAERGGLKEREKQRVPEKRKRKERKRGG